MASCPCQSGRTYKQCCGPLHKGAKKAPDPLTLMRSRYCAYAMGEVGYIIRTTEASRRSGLVRDELAAWCGATQWQGLRIIESGLDAERPDHGFVRFEADYLYEGTVQVHREFSRFEKIDYAWYYTDGDVETDNA